MIFKGFSVLKEFGVRFLVSCESVLAERPVISARAGTLKRKQQVRHFLEALPREDVEDAFSSAYMQNKRFEVRLLVEVL